MASKYGKNMFHYMTIKYVQIKSEYVKTELRSYMASTCVIIDKKMLRTICREIMAEYMAG